MNSIKRLFTNIWSVYNLPAYLFHEACHFIAMLILHVFIDKIHWNKSHFKIWINNKHLNWSCVVNLDCQYPLVSLIIISAPLIGWLIVFTLLLVNNHWLYIYFTLGPVMHFWMSPLDKTALTQEWDRLISNTKRAI